MAWSAPYTFSNGATSDATQVNANFASLAADMEYAFSTYKHVLAKAGEFVGLSASTRVLQTWSQPTTTSGVGPGSIFYLDPADYNVTGRTTKYRVKASAMTNATAPGVTFTVGLYPVTAVAGSGAGTLTATLGAVTPGSTVAFTTQAASTRGQGNSGDFTAPAAGFFLVAVVVSGSQAASSTVDIDVMLQVRQV